MGKKRSLAPLFPDSTVEEIARWAPLGELNGVTLAVYFRLLAASRDQGRNLEIPNRELVPGRTRANASVARALKELAAAKLVRVRREVSRKSLNLVRTIELLP